MNRKLLLIAAAAIFGAVSCNKLENKQLPQEEANATINISVRGEAVSTKALEAYTTVQTYEEKINKVQLLVFDSAGKINIYKNLGGSTSASLSTTAGTKKVWAVVNGPDLSSIATEAQLKATAITLADNSTASSVGFVMAGSNSCTVSNGGSADCTVSVSRFLSRIALRYVKNSLPSGASSLVVKSILLSNVVGNQNLAGDAPATTWLNKQGRSGDSSNIIDGSTYAAASPTLTYHSVGQSLASGAVLELSVPYLTYTYPNSSTYKPNAYSATFTAQCSVLVITAEVNGVTQYYSVCLDSSTLDRNKAYTVGVEITGEGSSEPNKEVEKGSVSVTLNVEPWGTGATYEETI